MKEKDIECAKLCMILSQTYFKVSSDPNKLKVFLQEAIELHDIFKQADFWEGIIKYSVNDELIKQRISDSDTPTERQLRMQSIAFVQIQVIVFNMNSFLIPKEKVKDIIIYFSKLYKLPEDMETQIIKDIEEYSPYVDRLVKNDILDDNICFMSEEGQMD